MRSYRLFILFIICAVCFTNGHAQDDKKKLATGNAFELKKDGSLTKDSVTTKTLSKKDTIPKHDPRKATRRSALIPGWGQAYNKEYWKIPIVYGIIAIPTVLYFYNDSYYKKTKFAYEAHFKAESSPSDTSDLKFIDPELKNLGTASLQSYRNAFRQSRDYSILYFLLAWGLQVADATVFAHLKQFDVSNDLSMQVTPTFNPITRSPGLGLTLNLKNNTRRAAVTR
ncbi:MAG: DUF5683 domain-containing protein [Sediminibacterium sp.]